MPVDRALSAVMARVGVGRGNEEEVEEEEEDSVVLQLGGAEEEGEEENEEEEEEGEEAADSLWEALRCPLTGRLLQAPGTEGIGQMHSSNPITMSYSVTQPLSSL
jgi:hypothetical protein